MKSLPKQPSNIDLKGADKAKDIIEERTPKQMQFVSAIESFRQYFTLKHFLKDRLIL